MDKDQPIETKNNESIPAYQPPYRPAQISPIQPQVQNIPETTTAESVAVAQPIVQGEPASTLTKSAVESESPIGNNNLAAPSLQNQQQPVMLPAEKANNTPLIISIVILFAIVGALVYLLFFVNHKNNLNVLNKQPTNISKPLDSEKVVNNEKLNPIKSITSASANSYIASNADNIKSGWKQVSVGQTATCGIKFDDKLYCWGGRMYGTFEADLGVSKDLNESTQPVAVVLSNGLDKEKIKKVVNGYGGSCVTTESGKSYCWGYNPSWGYGGWPKTFDGTYTPFVFDGGGVFTDKKINDIFLNSDGGCAISSDGVIYCWGFTNEKLDTTKPTEINTSGLLKDKTITSVESRDSTTCATTDDQKIYCWYNFSGSTVQSADKIKSLTPVEIDASGKLVGQKITKMSIGQDFACILTADSNVYCWGSGTGGELGDGNTSTSKKLVQVTNSGVLKGVKIVSITSGENHSCVLSDVGKIYCWGSNYYGELGNGTTTNSSVPVAVSLDGTLSGKQFVSVISYGDFTCAVDNDNQLYYWGYKTDVEYSKNKDDMMNKVPVKMFE